MNLDDKFPKRIPNATSTSDGLMSAADKAQLDRIFEYGAFAPATPENDGIMTKEDKIKLDNIEEGANKYVHPNDSNTRHVTDAQIARWDSNATGEIATQEKNGLMSKEDKVKLDGLQNYVHPNTPQIRHVTDEQIAKWDSGSSIDVATQEKNGLMSKEDKTKLDGVAAGANNYVHPNDANTRHVTDTEKATWNAKASTNKATQTDDGLMSASDKKKLDGIATGANNYVHPNDTNTRHVTDAQITEWNNKAPNLLSTTLTNGLMSATDKAKLDSIEEGANKYVHPDNENIRHVTDAQIARWNSNTNEPAKPDSNGLMSAADKIKLDGIEPGANKYVHPNDSNTRHVTDDQITLWTNKAPNSLASITINGLMSKEDKAKLDSIESGANKYVHPNNATTRHVTDTQISTWNNKAEKTEATSEAAGLMSASDKTKLDGIEAGANNYVHPNDANTRHVTDTEKATWNAKAPNTLASSSENGLMSKEDKAKLDSLVSGGKVIAETTLNITNYTGTIQITNQNILSATNAKIVMYAENADGDRYGHCIMQRTENNITDILTMFNGTVLDFVKVDAVWNTSALDITFDSITENIEEAVVKIYIYD